MNDHMTQRDVREYFAIHYAPDHKFHNVASLYEFIGRAQPEESTSICEFVRASMEAEAKLRVMFADAMVEALK